MLRSFSCSLVRMECLGTTYSSVRFLFALAQSFLNESAPFRLFLKFTPQIYRTTSFKSVFIPTFLCTTPFNFDDFWIRRWVGHHIWTIFEIYLGTHHCHQLIINTIIYEFILLKVSIVYMMDFLNTYQNQWLFTGLSIKI